MIFHGEVINTRDVITLQRECVSGLIKAFHDSVDDYLAFSKERGEASGKPFFGQFLTRIPPDLHHQVNIAVAVAGKSLNGWVTEQLKSAAQHFAATKVGGKKVAGKTKAAKKSNSREKDSPRHA